MNSESKITGAFHWLAACSLADSDTIKQAQINARRVEMPLVTFLVEQEGFDSLTIAQMASERFGLPLLDLDAIDPLSLPVGSIDNKQFLRCHTLPLGKQGNTLFMAVSDPACEDSLNEIKFQSGNTLELIVVEENKLTDAIREITGTLSDASGYQLPASAQDYHTLGQECLDETEENEATTPADETPVMRLVNKMLIDALRHGASDIHIEPYENTSRIRFREDGMLREIARPAPQIARKINARLKVMAQLDISEKRLPQDGRFKLPRPRSRPMDFRVNTVPTLWGEKSVIRILDQSLEKLDFDQLGFPPNQKQVFMEALNRKQGLILVTGPTGSGKSSSLYAGLKMLNTQDRNIATVEDPVEINVDGINQLAVNTAIGLDFAEALRAFLRQDPDVIMVGEIRDPKTAQIAFRAAQTGHLVVSTLHTNSAPETLARLADMGIPPYLIATSLSLVIAQRLLRRLCKYCKKPLKLPAKSLVQEGFSESQIENISLYAPEGCNKCHSGYRGRLGVYESVPITQSISRAIMDGGNSIQIADLAAKEGFNNVRESALEKAAQGMTSLAEVNRIS